MEQLKEKPDFKVVIKADRKPAGEHVRRFNEPTGNEVAIIMVNEAHGKRDIVLNLRNDTLCKINETHRSYDCLQYPLMFPKGEDGYNFALKQINPISGEETTKSISCNDFYAYRLMVRENEFNQVLRFKEITCRFIVDMYAKIESERLLYIRLNQKKLRAEQYIHLQDALSSDGNAENVGQQVILPSSFTGSPRYMQQRTQDAMCYVRKFGKPDLFITFTCNPKWTEIQEELFENQTQNDRHDVIARVFHEKQKKLLWLLKEGQIFGKLRAWLYTVEWQKRGLPHSHNLIWCEEKIRGEDIDNVIWAELPDPEIDPNLFEIIRTQMVHRPCGSMNRYSDCMKEGKCTKGFPKKFLLETQTGQDGYPLYRRRKPQDGGQTATIKLNGTNIQIDNSWIVPYNPLLSKTFQAHINVESCNSVKSIKYVCKYINKGSDMAVFGMEKEGEHQDEIKNFQMGRYISTNEAAWRIFGFKIHQRHPTVVNLAVHLENGQRVFFTESTARHIIEQLPETTLSAFFKLCQQDPFAQTLLYADIPSYYTWTNKKWARRKRGIPVEGWEDEGVFKDEAIGRVYTVHPNQHECFYLRLLLHTIRGPKSFDDLKTYNNRLCSTYREACNNYGLLEDDSHWSQTLEEAAAIKAPKQLRQLFAIMLTTCGLSDPVRLWTEFKKDMSEDILHHMQHKYPENSIDFDDNIFHEALQKIQQHVFTMGGENLTSFGLPQPEEINNNINFSEYLRETSYDIEKLAIHVDNNEKKLFEEQRRVYDAILNSIEEENANIFFWMLQEELEKHFLLTFC